MRYVSTNLGFNEVLGWIALIPVSQNIEGRPEISMTHLRGLYQITQMENPIISDTERAILVTMIESYVMHYLRSLFH